MIISIPKPITEALTGLFKHLDKIAEWRIIGGAVRDIILNKITDDIDIGIAKNPHEVIDALIGMGFKVIPTGLKHGTITVCLNNGYRVEITSLRKDVSCDGRRAGIELTNDWKEDAQRRDFTINAMSIDKEGNLYDYFNGYKDIIEGRLSFVGHPRRRIEEDNLRVLRYWRFLSNIDLPNIDIDSYNASLECFSMLQNISGERIQSEMMKLLSGRFAINVINILSSNNLLDVIGMPYVNKVVNFTSDPIVNLSILIRRNNHADTIRNIDSIHDRWRLSNAQRRVLTDISLPKTEINWHSPLKEHIKYIYKLGLDTYKKLELMAISEGIINLPISDQISEYIRPKMPINGNDINFLKGSDIKNALRSAEDRWIESDFLLNKEDLMGYIISKYQK